MKRRDFIHQTAASTALLSITGIGLSCTKSKTTKITILHTNDVHSHIDPFGQNEGENSNKGGIARRAALVESVRKENKHTLLLDAGDIIKSNKYLGSEFTLTGLVEHGNKLGRTINFPTANLKLEKNKIIPRAGVYLVKVSFNSLYLFGMLNIGELTNKTLNYRLIGTLKPLK